MELAFVVVMLLVGAATISYFLRWLLGKVLVAIVEGIMSVRSRWM